MTDIAFSKYAPTERQESNTHFYGKDEFTDVQTPTNVVVKTSASPHVTIKVIVAVVITVVVVATVATAVGVVLVNNNNNNGRNGATTAPTPGNDETTPQTTHVWTSWGAWTSCTATCGSGIEKRYRTCSESSSRCVGDYIEQQVCSQADCPVYGKWDSWSSWGSCDVTCGGGQQTRGRSCTKTSGSDIDCVGDEQQQEVCSDWACPNCTQACSIGTLNTECDTCICESNVITGRVVSSASGAGISSVYIYATSAPTRILTETNSTGFFTLEATCTMTELLLTRDGFLDSTVIVTSDDISINMTLIVLPYFTETPQSKYRLVGEDVILCCAALGSPNIMYYEWLKNSIILDSNLYPNGTHLYLTNVGVDDSGQYACRANSKVGAAISTAATLKVKETADDFCADALQQKTITLPDDCVQLETNTATYEIGECIAKRCRQDGVNETSSCRDNTKSCCGTYDAELKTVACTGYDLNVVVVKSCHCTACSSNSLGITGSALGVGTNSPLRLGEVRVNGEFTGYTSDIGAFSFSVAKDTAKIIINIKDNFYNQFLETTKVLLISDDMSGQIKVDIRVFEAGTTVEIQSTFENTLTAGGNTANESEATVQISVPANSFYNLDGSLYTGTVSSTLTFLDPTNTTYSSDIPGVFTFMNDEGEETNLGSLGVFNLFFKDDSGNNLVLNEPLEIYIPLNIGENGTTENFKLWKLSTVTGSWEIALTTSSNRRRKRQGQTGNLIGSIDTSTISDYLWWNVDQVDETQEEDLCYFKILTYKNADLEEPVKNPSNYIYIEQHSIDENGIFTTSTLYTQNPFEECLTIVCREIDGYLSAYQWTNIAQDPLYFTDPIVTSGTQYTFESNNRVLAIKSSKSTDGPFYSNKTTCQSSTKKDNHFPLHFNITDYDFPPVKLYTPIAGNIADNMKLSREAFYPNRGGVYTACMIKIKIIFSSDIPNISKLRIKVTSSGGTNADIAGIVLGIFERTLLPSTTDSITECIEYKCSGIIDPEFFSSEDLTKVVVSLSFPDNIITCNVNSESDRILTDQPNESQLGMGTFTVYAPIEYGPDYGIYSDTTDRRDIPAAVGRASLKCQSAQAINNTEINPDAGLAVVFSCPPKPTETAPIPGNNEPLLPNGQTTQAPTSSVTTPTTTTITTAAVPTTTTTSPSTEVWETWEAWTSCTATCGSGIETRYRTCSELSSSCLDDSVEQQVCSQTDCPVYGKWDSWSSWGSCDVTCGGGQQTRVRSCTKTSGSDIDCVGDEQQQEVCSDWTCPDCSQICSIGTLNTECDTCICESNVITGRVVSSASGAGISSVYIYATSAPTRMLTETNSTGFFTLEATCTTSELLLTREGFLDSTVIVTSEDLSITMTLIVLPYFTETPQSKYRLVGEDVILCCAALGSPNILYYEWLKNSILLDSNLYPNGTRLYLTNVGVDDSGQYACRANSKVGAAISTAATLKIKETEADFCSDALQQKTITLPDDCVQPETNTATYEIGECIAKRCRQDGVNETSSCRDGTKSCCGTYEAELKTVTCTGYDLNVVVVKSCHCTACSSNSLEISGSALGVGTDAPLRFGEVRVNGEFTGYTSNIGAFSFSVTKDTAKVIINIKDNVGDQFLETTKVIPISNDMSGQIKVDIRVFEAGTTVELQSSLENTLTFRGIQISVPANSFYSLDGSPYTGTVSSALTFLDPTNTTYRSDIPGVFTFMNDEGEETNLGSLGVFNLFFKDDSGNNLVLNETLEIFIPLYIGVSGTTENFKLWKLSTDTGSWENALTTSSNEQQERQSQTGNLIGFIDTSAISVYNWWNIDLVDASQSDELCYFKIRTYKNVNLQEPVQNPSNNIEIEHHSIHENGIFTTSGHSTRNPFEECLTIVCREIDGYLSAYQRAYTGNIPLYVTDPIVQSGTQYTIESNNRVLAIKSSKSTDGPFYSNKAVCQASTKEDNHFPFHFNITDYDFPPVKLYTAIEGPITDNMKLSREAFYPDRDGQYTVCMIKIKIIFSSDISSISILKIKVTSSGGTNTDIAGIVLGIFERALLPSTTDSITECIEYKCSGIIDPEFFGSEDLTKVVVSLSFPDIIIECNINSESDSLLTDQPNESQVGMGNFTVYAPIEYGPDYGIYDGTTDKGDIPAAVGRASSKCKSAQALDTTEINPDIGLAVTFSCEPKPTD